ncbi:MAG: pantetheine-phosphate adenylyltransferase [Acidimicrobiales bacterium]|nr:pantetheine-phosphate adenylyltransferase [Acidimicrobiales bacterium]
MATALVPGSFNPIHLGHVRIIETVAATFDRVVVAAVGNPNKAPDPFTLDERRQLIADSLRHLPNVDTTTGSGLVVEVAREVGATAIVKGLRGVADFESEVQMAHMNLVMSGIPTMFVPTALEHGHLASSLIREIARLGGNVEAMVPSPVARALAEHARRS